jgi:3-hydroxybutyrate dehydrogenase
VFGRLSGRVALVTGANGGLGKSICDVLTREGSSVFKVDLHADDCFHADIATEAGNKAMIEAALETYGKLDTLVLNAAIQQLSPINAFSADDWQRMMDVTVTGPFFAIKHAWQELTKQPGGRIVLTASLSSFYAEKFKSAYTSAKHAVLGLMRSAALEGVPHQLTANAVAPDWMNTPIVHNQIKDQARLYGQTEEQVWARIKAEQLGGRFVETKEVAEVIAFLASNAASGLNGVCIPVDLGYSAFA